jgi:pyrroline-5-carboxylate reductase
MQPVISIIGSGVMGEAIIGGLLRKKVTIPAHIHASDPLPERRVALQEQYGIEAHTDNTSSVKYADIVILSVKPQRLDKVLAGLRDLIPPHALVLSIVAGASIEQIST